jgi:hypothetical protein
MDDYVKDVGITPTSLVPSYPNQIIDYKKYIM